MTRPVRSLVGAALVAGAAVLAGCTDWAAYDVDVAAGKVPQLATMRKSIVPDPYGMPREAPVGSVPVSSPSGAPAHISQASLDSAAATLTNPLASSAAVLARGKLKYEQNCTACHGPAGAGDGPVVGNGKFPFAPTLVAGTAPARSDGYLYAVIVAGRNFMPPYGERINEADRWAVVHYVRQLQGGAGAQPAVATPLVAAPALPAAAAPTPTPAPDTAGGAQP
jgi:mono/diheme cytochrome c family protein